MHIHPLCAIVIIIESQKFFELCDAMPFHLFISPVVVRLLQFFFCFAAPCMCVCVCVENVLYHYRFRFEFVSHFNDGCAPSCPFIFGCEIREKEKKNAKKIEKVKHEHKQLEFTTAVLNWIVVRALQPIMYK